MSEEPKRPLINIGDFAGLKEPILKLISTIEAGCGRLINPLWLNKKDADNEAYRIEKVGAAETKVLVERAQAIAGLASGEQRLEKMDIAGNSIQAQLGQPSPKTIDLIARSNNRVAYQNAMSQLNIEAINGYAADALESETYVSEEPVNQTWVNRFYRKAEDVTEPDIQAMWGRILAGEVRQPGSFSLRTLDVLSTLTQAEAQDFQRLCSYVWRDHNDNDLIPIIGYRAEMETSNPSEKNAFKFVELTHLQDVGLINFGHSDYVVDSLSNMSYNDSKLIDVASHQNKERIFIGRVTLSKIGREIFPICTPEYSNAIMDKCMKYWLDRGYSISSQL